MKYPTTLIFIILFISQNIVTAKSDSTQNIKLYINCNADNCFENYLKMELNYFDFVRDRLQSDIEIIVISMDNGAGGLNYKLLFNGRNTFENLKDTLELSTKQTDTDDLVREKILKAIQIGLIPYLKKSKILYIIDISYPKRDMNKALVQNDKWRNWVFTLSGNGYVNAESNQTNLNLGSFLDINKIKHEIKFQNSIYYYSSYYRFVFSNNDNESNKTITAQNVNYGASSFLAKSISAHWAAGAYISVLSSQRQNVIFQSTIAPAIEYNLFPISENAERQFRFIFQSGYRTWKLNEVNNYNKLNEAEPFNRLDIVINYIKSWGNISMQLGANHFYNRKSSYNISGNLSASLRIFEGFNFNISMSSSYIQDQDIYLPKNIIETNVLLGTGILPTNFNIYSFFGLSYTFGSINNSVVNPRLEEAIW
ncbi:MAG: hypothetical protein ACK4IK_08415 [Bacteroidia bacterium]